MIDQQPELTALLAGPKLWGKSMYASVGTETLTLCRASFAGWLRSFLGWVIGGVLNDQMVAGVLHSLRKRSVNEFFKVTLEKERYCDLFYQQVRASQGREASKRRC